MVKREVDILLVEDSPNDVELTLHALRRQNLANHVVVVRDGEEALDFLYCRGQYADRTNCIYPRIVLLDLKLPKIDGLEVLRQLKSNEATRAIPVVVLTASKEEQDLVRGYRLGANGYVQKPLDFDEFRETVKKIGLFWLLVNQAPPPAAFLVERSNGK